MLFNRDRARELIERCALHAVVATSAVNVTYLRPRQRPQGPDRTPG